MTNGNFVELMIIEIETNNPAKILPQISPCVIKFEEDDVHQKCYSCGKTGNMHRILKYKVVLWREQTFQSVFGCKVTTETLTDSNS